VKIYGSQISSSSMMASTYMTDCLAVFTIELSPYAENEDAYLMKLVA
jgi:hypothetical protein